METNRPVKLRWEAAEFERIGNEKYIYQKIMHDIVGKLKDYGEIAVKRRKELDS